MGKKDDLKTNLKITFKGFLSIWRVIVFLISLGIILPLSLAKIDTKGFYYTIFIICGVILLLCFIARMIAEKFKKVKIKFVKNYLLVMFHYSFVTFALYLVTFLLMLGPYQTLTYVFMVFSAIALSLTISRAKILLVFI